MDFTPHQLLNYYILIVILNNNNHILFLKRYGKKVKMYFDSEKADDSLKYSGKNEIVNFNKGKMDYKTNIMVLIL